MANNTSRRTLRHSVNAFEPASRQQGQTREQGFFGPVNHEPFFASTPHALSAPVSGASEAQRQPSEEEQKETIAPQLARAAIDEEVAREPNPEEQEAQAKLSREEQPEEEAQAKLSREEQPEEEAQAKLSREEQPEEKEQAQAKLSRQADPEQERTPLSAKSGSADPVNSRYAGDATVSYVRHIGSRGQPLAAASRSWFERRMGYDLSHVRIHTGREAEASARASRARAYTYQNHVVFAPGQHDEDSHAGRALMAHELTHVVQQGNSTERGNVQSRIGRRVQRGIWDTLWQATGIPDLAENVMAAGAWVYNLAAWAPSRVWALLVHQNSGLLGTFSWLWQGLVNGLAHYWNGAQQVLPWLQAGVQGLFGWVWQGLSGAGNWAWRLINGDFNAIWDGLAGAFGWLGAGVRGLLDWQWQGLTGLLVWTAQGNLAFARWLWDGASSGMAWLGRYLAKVLDLIGAGELWTFTSSALKRYSTRMMNAGEQAEAQRVFGAAIPYWQVRIDEGSLIALFGRWLKGESSMGVTIAQTINFDRPINASAGSSDMAWLIHELTHVAQYTHVGLQYLGEAIHAQATDGYAYGGGAALVGKNLADFNREQQGDILRHYYLRVLHGNSPYAADYQRMRDQASQGKF